MAVLAHVLQLVGGVIAPSVIFIIRRHSRFASFHALQVLFLQLIYMAVNGCLVALWMSGFLFAIVRSHEKSVRPPTELLFIFPIVMVVFMVMWILTIVLGITYSVKAGRGEWAEYPLLGSWARRVLNVGPGGEQLS